MSKEKEYVIWYSHEQCTPRGGVSELPRGDFKAWLEEYANLSDEGIRKAHDDMTYWDESFDDGDTWYNVVTEGDLISELSGLRRLSNKGAHMAADAIANLLGIAGVRVNCNRTPYADELICYMVAKEIAAGKQPVIENLPNLSSEAPMWKRMRVKMYVTIEDAMVLIRWTPTEEGYSHSEETGDDSYLCDWDEIAYAEVDRDRMVII